MELRRLFLSATLLASVLGCSKSGDPSATPSASAVSAEKPDVAVKGMMDAALAGDATVAWNILPNKQQADVKSLVETAGAKVDPEVYNKAFAVLGKAVEVLKTKKDYFLGSNVMPPMTAEEKEELARNWSHVVDIVEALATSEIKTVDGLKGTDPGKFLATTGSKMLSSALAIAEGAGPNIAGELNIMKNSKVSVVKQEGDTATLKLETEGSPAKEKEFKRVEGKWMPADLLDGWDGGVADLKKSLDDAVMTPEQKTQALGVIAQADAFLDQLLATKSQTEFDAALAPIAAMAPLLLQNFGGGPSPGPMGPSGLGAPASTGPGSLPMPGTLPTPTGTMKLPPLNPGAGGPVLPGSAVPAAAPSGGPVLPGTP